MTKLSTRDIDEALNEGDLSDLWRRNEERLDAERQERLRDLKERLTPETD